MNEYPQLPVTDYQMRLAALENAVRHRFKDEGAESVVKTAEIYLTFLKKSNGG